MFCSKCGKALASFQKFCPECGNPVNGPNLPTEVGNQRSTSTPIIQARSNPYKEAVVVSCFVLSIIAMFTLNRLAAVLAILFIVTGGLCLFSKRFSIRTKVFSVGIAIALIATLNGFEDWQERVQKQHEADASKQREIAKAEENRKKEEDFKALSSSAHLEQAKALLTVTALPGQVSEGLRHLASISSNTPEAIEGSRIKKQYYDAKQRQAEVAARAASVAAKNRTAEEAKVSRILRDAMAKTLENKLLDEGYNVDVKATGQDHKTLYIKWILVNKALAHQLSNEGDFFQNARTVGFKRIELSDGYDETWYWDLK